MIIRTFLIKNRILGNQSAYHLCVGKFFSRLSVISNKRMESHNMTAENTPTKIALFQVCSTPDKEATLQKICDMIEQAAADGAKMMYLPECFDFVARNAAETLKLSEPLDGFVIDTYKKLAIKHKIWLSLGGFHLHNNDEENPLIRNAHLLIDDSGQLKGHYNKLHLFDVNVDAKTSFTESKTVKGGSQLVPPIKTPAGMLGMLICYDVRFGEVAILLRKMGAQILTYPSAFAYGTGIAHWEVLMRARAIESQCYVISAAQYGYHHEKRRSWGHAMVVDPWGDIIAECAEEKDCYKLVDIDIAKLDKVRRNMPCFDHRRNDIYQLKLNEDSKQILTNNVTDNGDKYFTFGENKIPIETVFFESALTFAFTNIRCVVPGHVLVATKAPRHRLKDLTNEEITDFFQTVCVVQKNLENFYGATSSTVTVQDGKDAGQTVQHVHCHVMPRRENDFEHNDLIYVELNRHDHFKEDSTDDPNLNTTTSRRSITEMVNEATKLRALFI